MDKNTRKYNDLLKGIFWSEKVTTIWKSTKVVGRSQRYSEIQWNNNWIETKRSNQEKKKKKKSISYWSTLKPNPAGLYLLKVNNRNTKAKYNICSKLTIKTTEQCQRRINVFLDPQCIVIQEDLQQNILNRSTFLPLLSLHTTRARKRGQELWELSINSEATV